MMIVRIIMEHGWFGTATLLTRAIVRARPDLLSSRMPHVVLFPIPLAACRRQRFFSLALRSLPWPET